MAYQGNPQSSPLVLPHGLYVAEVESWKRGLGYGHPQACGHRHLQTGRWRQDRFELGWSVDKLRILPLMLSSGMEKYHQDADVEFFSKAISFGKIVRRNTELPSAMCVSFDKN